LISGEGKIAGKGSGLLEIDLTRKGRLLGIF